MSLYDQYPFKIVEISEIAKTDNHIPYLGYVLIKGPRGGTYLLDLYNMELLLKVRYRNQIMTNIERNILSYGRRNGLIKRYDVFDTSDKALTTYARQIGAHPVIRNHGRESFNTLRYKLDIHGIILEV